MFDVLTKKWPSEKWLRSDALDMEGAATEDRKIRVFWSNGRWKVLASGIVGTGLDIDSARSNWIHKVESSVDLFERVDTTRVGETIAASKRPFLLTPDMLAIDDTSD